MINKLAINNQQGTKLVFEGTKAQALFVEIAGILLNITTKNTIFKGVSKNANDPTDLDPHTYELVNDFWSLHAIPETVIVINKGTRISFFYS